MHQCKRELVKTGRKKKKKTDQGLRIYKRRGSVSLSQSPHQSNEAPSRCYCKCKRGFYNCYHRAQNTTENNQKIKLLKHNAGQIQIAVNRGVKSAARGPKAALRSLSLGPQSCCFSTLFL